MLSEWKQPLVVISFHFYTLIVTAENDKNVQRSNLQRGAIKTFVGKIKALFVVRIERSLNKKRIP